MAKILEGLLNLQTIERQLTLVKAKLKTRQNAVAFQQRRIEQAQADHLALQDKATQRRKDADGLELDLKTKEEQVARYRIALNTAKTNKEYSAILTQINTIKADNARIEEEVLRIRVEIDSVGAEAQKAAQQVLHEQERLKEVQATNTAELDKLNAMHSELAAKRQEAAKDVARDILATFDRLSEQYEGEAMAAIEIHGKRPPFEYVCGGCYMGLNAEHANALSSPELDQVRTCDNCGRILYLPPKAAKK
ncbi:MAG: hypothetical protein HZA50_13470 [Planctomycetes bacterium]|nr:hypothetical protein [Planctomycetota bacterium]